jgi:signal transduction histidine kinase
MQGFQHSAMPPLKPSTSTLKSLADSDTALNHHDGIKTTASVRLEAAPPLLFSIDDEGTLLSLGWPLAKQYHIDLQACLGKSLEQLVTVPTALPQDLASDRPFISSRPWQLQFPSCRLQGNVQVCTFENALQGPQWVGMMQVSEVVFPAQRFPGSAQAFRSQLTQLTWNIRRTLDLETIRQQTVEGLIEVLPAEWSVFCTYAPHAAETTVVATAAHDPHLPNLEGTMVLADYPGLQAATRAKQPLVLDDLNADITTASSSGRYLVTMTRHQGEPNGLLILKAATSENWEHLNLLLLQEILDQVGTAIAHAHLFRDAQGLADELQAANQRLRQKHRELEEARQQAEEASRLKSEFLANTSHELRTPLNGMIGFLRLILDGMADDPEEQEDFLQEAHKSALHLLNLINDVLDIAKIEAGKMQIDMSPVKLRELFADVENFTRPQAEQKGLRFAISLPSTRDEIVVNGNYQRLLQVMLNLVGNAIKFTHEGSITIGAEIKSQKIHFQDHEWPGFVKVSVADTGIGVSLEKQNRLFQTFSQVDGERTRQYGGTGLGLAISQRLIEAMGGVVQFISMGEGLGSTVTFTTLLYQEPVLVE